MIQDAIKELQAVINRYERIKHISINKEDIELRYYIGKHKSYIDFKDAQSMLEWCENNLTEVEAKK